MVKRKTGSASSPSVPPFSEWRRAPFLGPQDSFWDVCHNYSATGDLIPDPVLIEEEPEVDAGSWVLPSSIPRFAIERGDFPYSFIKLESHAYPAMDWEDWTHHILDTPEYVAKLRSAGIFIAVSLCASLTTRRNHKSLATLLSRWSSSTHTFITAWGEFTPTLEDVNVLLRLPIFGEQSLDPDNLSEQDQRIVRRLQQCFTEASNSGSRFKNGELLRVAPAPRSIKCAYGNWTRYFFRELEPMNEEIRAGTRERRSVNGPQFNSNYTLAGFLAMWLDRYIFESKPEDGLSSLTFPIAAILSRGTILPLAPMFLGTLYMKLDSLHDDMRISMGRYHVRSYIPCFFLILFLYEHFPDYAPTPKVLSPSDGNKSYSHAAKWSGLTSSKRLSYFIDDDLAFAPRPYTAFSCGVFFPKFYSEEDKQITLTENSSAADFKMAAMITRCHLPGFDERGLHSLAYNPNRVARQFGFDQGIPGHNSSWVLPSIVQNRFLLPKISILIGETLPPLIPSSQRDGTFTEMFRLFWRGNLNSFDSFTSGVPDTLSAGPVPKASESSFCVPKGKSDRGALSRFAEHTDASTSATATAAPCGRVTRSKSSLISALGTTKKRKRLMKASQRDSGSEPLGIPEDSLNDVFEAQGPNVSCSDLSYIMEHIPTEHDMEAAAAMPNESGLNVTGVIPSTSLLRALAEDEESSDDDHVPISQLQPRKRAVPSNLTAPILPPIVQDSLNDEVYYI